MNTLEKVANILGVELYEEFTVTTTEVGSGHEVDKDTIYRFDLELVHKGYDDGWSKWYGRNEKILYYLCIGIYKIVKKEGE